MIGPQFADFTWLKCIRNRAVEDAAQVKLARGFPQWPAVVQREWFRQCHSDSFGEAIREPLPQSRTRVVRKLDEDPAPIEWVAMTQDEASLFQVLQPSQSCRSRNASRPAQG